VVDKTSCSVSSSRATASTDRATWDQAIDPRMSFPVSALSRLPKWTSPSIAASVFSPIFAMRSRPCRICRSLSPSRRPSMTLVAASRTTSADLWSRIASTSSSSSSGKTRGDSMSP
jgi:hypothetical protein